jgi:DNA-directed RNA polymerase specialized sigma24 family protein
LVRCVGYTNSRRQAQQIGTYVLTCTCLASSELKQREPFGVLVDVMMDVVGPDVVLSGEGQEWWGQCAEPLIVDGRMRTLANALNLLERPLREALVLRHVTGKEVDELAALLESPASEIAVRLERAETRLADLLSRPDVTDVRSLLKEFAAGLDTDWLQEVTRYAMEYLTSRVKRGS